MNDDSLNFAAPFSSKEPPLQDSCTTEKEVQPVNENCSHIFKHCYPIHILFHVGLNSAGTDLVLISCLFNVLVWAQLCMHDKGTNY
jgi:hypothetical protein